MINWLRGLFCESKTGHIPSLRYSGLCVLGYKCASCGYEWYEKRKTTKPKLTLVTNQQDADR